MDAESKCPVMHGAITKNMGEGTSNRANGGLINLT